MACDLGAVQHEAIARSNLSEHCMRTGEALEALENSSAAVRLCREKGLDYYLGSYLLVHARALLLSGRPEEALAALDEAAALPMTDDYDRMAGLAKAEAMAQIGRPEEAVPILGRIAESSDLEVEAEARWLLWRITSDEGDREKALLSNRRWLEEVRYPWVAASRLESMGEDVSSLPPVPRSGGGTAARADGTDDLNHTVI